jgi:hypothetical protein
MEKVMSKTFLSITAAAILGTLTSVGAYAQADVQNDRTDMRQDRRDIRQDQQQLRQDLRDGNTAGANQLRKDINGDEKDLTKDRHDMRDDRRDLHQDMDATGGIRR